MSGLLVVVDMQHFFATGQPWAVPGFEELARPIGTLVAAFGDRVLFTRFTVPAKPEGSWIPYYQAWPQVTGPDSAPLADLAPPWAGRPTLDRPTFSKWGPELAAAAGPARELVLCGVSTDCCVLATALAAADDGASVRVVADACAGVDEGAHERALALLAGFAPQITLSSVAAELPGHG